MRTLLYGGTVVNVFTDTLEKASVLIENDRIIGVGDYTKADVDITAGDSFEDVSGKFICPGFIDGHIHIESTMLTPANLARVSLPRGTTSIVADPHEIANVCGTDGIKYMLAMSDGIPQNVFIMLPSCVPATPFDEPGATLEAGSLRQFYDRHRVLGLAEMMDYPGVIKDEEQVHEKIKDAFDNNKVVDGHAPMVTGRDLDKYISSGISSDHECTSIEEALEKLSKGQWLMIREGTAARNLQALLPLFEEPYNRRCLLVTDDKHPTDIINDGHIDWIIREAVEAGKSPIVAIRMASLHAAERFGILQRGAVAPGFIADVLVLDDLEKVKVRDVYTNGNKVVDNGKVIDFEDPEVASHTMKAVLNSFYMDEITEEKFRIPMPLDENGKSKASAVARVIGIVPGELLTEELHLEINDIDKESNGIDLDRDILKLAVLERHMDTGHAGLGYIKGIGIKRGAIAASVSHDSHNLIVIGTNDKDMAVAAERVRKLRGGMVAVDDGEIIAEMQLEIAGLMTTADAKTLGEQNLNVRKAANNLGAPEHLEPFMNMAFVSLPVIPDLKMSTQGLVNVNKQERVDLFL